MENENVENEKVTTRSIGIRFGLYGALARILLFAIAIVLNVNAFDGPVAWTGMVVGLVLIVLAHRQFKNDGNGYMDYGQGVGIGFWMGLVGTLIVVPIMYVYLNFIDSAPFDLFLEKQEETMIARGTPEQAIEMAMKWTKNIFWPMAVIGGILGSVIFALIISIFTKKSNPEMSI